VAGDALLAGYAGLFAAAFLGATLFPAHSELILSAMLLSGRYDVAASRAVATAGNVLGSTLNWTIGRFLAHQKDARWFPVSPRAMARAERWYGRWGLATLLLSWVPVIGDPLTLVAGVLRARLLPFLLIVTLAKGGRYAALAAVLAA